MNYAKLKQILMDEVEDDKILEMVRACNSWDGSLEEFNYEDNEEEFFNTYFYNKPYDVARAITNGSYDFYDGYLKFDYCDKSITSYSWNDVVQELFSGRETIIDTFINLLEGGGVDEDCIRVYVTKVEELEDEYSTYVEEWNEEHNEGEPSCFDEWYDNEYGGR